MNNIITLKTKDIKEQFVFYLDTKKLNNLEYYYKLHETLTAYSLSHWKLRNEKALIKTSDNRLFSMRLSELVIHLKLWLLLIYYKEKINSKYIYELHPLSFSKLISILTELVDSKINNLISKNKNLDEISNILGKINEMFCELADSYGFVSANTFSLYDILSFSKRNKKFKDMINIKLDPNKKMEDIEIYLNTKRKELIDIFKKDKYNNIYPFLRSGTCINEIQLAQLFVGVGPRSTASKIVMQYPITRNMLHGLTDAAEAFVESVTTRNALLVKFTAVPKSGYLSKIVNTEAMDTYINKNIVDCNSKNYLTITIKNKSWLKIFKDKYYLTEKGLEILSDKDEHLIGETLRFRTIIACALHPSEGICKTCFGNKWKRVRDIRVGGLPAIEVNNPVSNAGMSLKHKLFTVSYRILDEYLIKYFKIENNTLFIKTQYLDKIQIIIPTEIIKDTVSNQSLDFEDDTIRYINTIDEFKIKNLTNGDIYTISNEGIYFSLNDYFIKENKFIINRDNHNETILDISNLTNQDPILTKIVLTEEVSIFLKAFISLINSTKTKSIETYDLLMINILQLIEDMGIKNIIGFDIEIIIYNMIRSVTNDYIRPNFSKFGIPYQILRLSESVIKRETLGPGLAFERYNQQLTSWQTFRLKKYDSIYDILFGL